MLPTLFFWNVCGWMFLCCDNQQNQTQTFQQGHVINSRCNGLVSESLCARAAERYGVLDDHPPTASVQHHRYTPFTSPVQDASLSPIFVRTFPTKGCAAKATSVHTTWNRKDSYRTAERNLQVLAFLFFDQCRRKPGGFVTKHAICYFLPIHKHKLWQMVEVNVGVHVVGSSFLTWTVNRRNWIFQIRLNSFRRQKKFSIVCHFLTLVCKEKLWTDSQEFIRLDWTWWCPEQICDVYFPVRLTHCWKKFGDLLLWKKHSTDFIQ